MFYTQELRHQLRLVKEASLMAKAEYVENLALGILHTLDALDARLKQMELRIGSLEQGRKNENGQ